MLGKVDLCGDAVADIVKQVGEGLAFGHAHQLCEHLHANSVCVSKRFCWCTKVAITCAACC